MRILLLALTFSPGTVMAYDVVADTVPTALVDDHGPADIGYTTLDGHRLVRTVTPTPARVDGASKAALLAWVDTLPGKRNAQLAAALRLSPLHRDADPNTTVSDPTSIPGHWVRQAYAAETTDGVRVRFAYHWVSPDELHWRERVLIVHDGGVAHFEVTWNPKTKTFSELHIHGEA